MNKLVVVLLSINTILLGFMGYDKFVKPHLNDPAPILSLPTTPAPAPPKTVSKPPKAVLEASKGRSLESVKSFGTLLSSVEVPVAVRSEKDLLILNIADKNSKLLTAADIQKIKDSGKIVLANLSVGYAESYRWYWNPDWKTNQPAWLGEEKDDEKNKYLVRDIMNRDWMATIFTAVDRLIEIGYDGVVLNGLESYIYMGGAKKLRDNVMDFTIALSSYTKKTNPNFLIFAKNTELLYKNSAYMDAIDGIVKEPLFFSLVPGVKRGADEITKILTDLKNYTEAGKKVLVIEWNAPASRWPSEYDERLKRNKMLGYNAPSKTQNSIRD